MPSIHEKVQICKRKESLIPAKRRKKKSGHLLTVKKTWKFFRVYSDPGFTGANINRPALNEVLNDIKQNKINLVVSYKIDRLLGGSVRSGHNT